MKEKLYTLSSTASFKRSLMFQRGDWLLNTSLPGGHKTVLKFLMLTVAHYYRFNCLLQQLKGILWLSLNEPSITVENLDIL